MDSSIWCNKIKWNSDTNCYCVIMLINSVVSEAGSAETRPRPRHGYPRPRRDRDTGIARPIRDRDMAIRDWDETETAKEFYIFFCVFFFLHLLNLLWPFWGLYTVDSRYNKLLGPSEITLLYQNFVISGLQNNKIQRNFELWDQENYFVISDFVILVLFITRVHCIYLAAASLRPRAETSRHSLRGRGRGRDIRLRGRDEAKDGNFRPRGIQHCWLIMFYFAF